jgi:hypothetical protein
MQIFNLFKFEHIKNFVQIWIFLRSEFVHFFEISNLVRFNILNSVQIIENINKNDRKTKNQENRKTHLENEKNISTNNIARGMVRGSQVRFQST